MKSQCAPAKDTSTSKHLWNTLTGCYAVDKSADRTSIVPIRGEVGHWFIRLLVLHPAEKTLFRRLLWLPATTLVIVPDRHRDGVVQDQGPDQSEDQLQLVIHDV